jgi:putative transcriptional regulator
MSLISVLTSEHSIAPRTTGARRILATCLLGGLLTALHAAPALAGNEFAQSSVGKGVLLVASPMLDDPNFRQTVVLVLEHGPEGTLGLILNRSTNVLLSEAFPDLIVLKGTTYRLFAGGPVEPTRLLLLFRLK